jgi:iron(III) transport system substrate-binding protein
MRKLTRRTFLAGSSALVAATATQWGRPPRAKAQASALNLYTSRHYDTDDALYNSFTETTGIRVNMVEASADELIERIKSEGDNSPADILITVDAGRLWRAEQDGLFQPVDSAILNSAVPEYLRHPDGQWFGFSKRARVLMYNKDRVNPTELSTYEDLVDPKWSGRLLTRSSTNIYSQSLTGALIHHLGEEATEEWARGFVANFARQPEGNDTAQIQAVAAGVGDVAIANSYYLARLMKSDDPADQAVAEQVGMFFPNQDGRGTHVNISGGGVLRSASNYEAAVQFLEHLVSPEAQQYFATGNNEYPVVDGTEVDPVLASFGTFKEDNIDARIFGSNNDEALRLMDRAGWV